MATSSKAGRGSIADWVQRGVDALRGKGSFIFLALSAVAGACSALDRFTALALWLAAAFAALGVTFELLLKPTYVELARELEEARTNAAAIATAMQESVRKLVIAACRAGGLTEVHQRISVYAHTDHEFVMLARWSNNADLTKAGRGVYPDDQGVIAQAWQNREFFAREWPEEEKAWLQIQREHGVPDDVAKGLRMRSLSIAAWRVDANDQPIGVVVLESTSKRGVKQQTVKDIRECEGYKGLHGAIESSIPSAATIATLARRALLPAGS